MKSRLNLSLATLALLVVALLFFKKPESLEPRTAMTPVFSEKISPPPSGSTPTESRKPAQETDHRPSTETVLATAEELLTSEQKRQIEIVSFANRPRILQREIYFSLDREGKWKPSRKVEFHADQILVQVRSGVSEEDLVRHLASADLFIKRKMRRSGSYVVGLKKIEINGVRQALKSLPQDLQIESSSLDIIFRNGI